MAYHLRLRRLITLASLALAGLCLPAPHIISAAQGQTGGAGLCEFSGNGRYYFSAVFDVPDENNRDKWEVAWGYYVQKQVGQFPGNSYCQYFRTRAAGEQSLQGQIARMGAKVVQTGWAYTGPSQLPPAPATRPKVFGIGPR